VRGRRQAVAVLAVTLLAACDSSTHEPHKTVLVSPVRSAADLSCSLPVVSPDRAGFLDFPSGRFREDRTYPRSQFGVFYAYGARRWVTTFYTFGYASLSPDGTQIAEVTRGTDGYANVSLTDIRTHESRLLGKVPGGGRILGFLSDGLYLAGGVVYRMNLKTGDAVLLGPNGPDASRANQGLWFWVTSAGAWYSLIAGPNQLDGNPVLSMSLTDGSLTTWYTAPPTRSVSIIGFVKPDEPLAVEYNREPFDRMTGVQFMLLTKPGSVQTLALDPSINAWGFTDSMGVWLSSPGRLWLYNEAGLNPIADVSGAIGSYIPGVAGGCR
jgi:hypothetical protein